MGRPKGFKRVEIKFDLNALVFDLNAVGFHLNALVFDLNALLRWSAFRSTV